MNIRCFLNYLIACSDELDWYPFSNYMFFFHFTIFFA